MKGKFLFVIVGALLSGLQPVMCEILPAKYRDVDCASNIQDANDALGAGYRANEIIVKFKKPIADIIAEEASAGGEVCSLKLSDSLNVLQAKYRFKNAKALFLNFKQKRQQMGLMLQKDEALLSTKERHILKRQARAPKGALVPDLDRIYKIGVDLEDGQLLEDVVAEYNKDPGVEYAELNYIVSIDLAPNDPLFGVQWPLNNTGQMYPESGKYNDPPGTVGCDIDALEAWNVEKDSSDIIIAVVDTGVDYTHRDLDDNMWTDPNGNHGYDFYNDDADPIDDHGHGTHCAGIIAAEGNNALDITGVCWDAKIMAVKFLNSNGSGSYDDAAEAFYYAVDNGADILSNSWGETTSFSQIMQDAIDYAYSQGVIVVAAAGNEAQYYFPHYPASMEHVISVVATNSNDERAPFSTYGDWVDICAPGVDILSLRASGTSMGTVYDDYTTIASGTSMACPCVAGVIGLLISEYPAISYEEMEARLLSCADDIFGENPDCEGLLGSGRVNAHKALRFNSEGIVSLDRGKYSCSDSIGVQLSDFDVRATGSQVVTLTTDGGDSEILIVTEDPNSLWIFTGSIGTSSEAVVSGNGILEVLHGENITVGYTDQHYGGIGQYLVEETACVDFEEPNIFNVKVYDVTSSGVRVKFETNELTSAIVRCGLVFEGPYPIIGEDVVSGNVHDIYLTGLDSQTDYYFVVEANDIAGNQTVYTSTFSTLEMPEGLHVPSEYLTIQEGIDAAVDGDIIWIADGVYTGEGNRDIDYYGKAITVKSENGPENCIVDCEDLGRGFFFQSGEDGNSILEGLTVTGGRTYSDQLRYGGGIACKSGPIIRNCIITGNRARNGGGGICGGDPIITDCVIKNNTGGSAGGIWGGSVVVTNCIISGNLATGDYGGGICCWQDSYPIIKNCLIKNNASLNNGRGGGMSFLISYPTVENCLFIDNFCISSYLGGGAIYVNHTNANITNCTFYGNTTIQTGGACHFGGNGDVYVKNCIFAENYPNQIYRSMTVGRVYVTYSDVQGGYSGSGNISSEPCFADAFNDDLHLKSESGRWDPETNSWVVDYTTSPCIDKGSSAFDWTEELWPHGKRINMGAYGGTSQASMSSSAVGNKADLNNDDAVDGEDLALLGDAWLLENKLLSENINRNDSVNFFDFAEFAGQWFWEE